MGIKPNKTRRFALRRGFSGLIYALDTESPRTGIGGQEFQGKPRRPETPERDGSGGEAKELGQGNMADSREVMNIRQASQYLGVSPDTLYKYVGEQRIPAFKLGNRWRFKKSKLDQWMEEKSSQMESGTKHKPKAATKAAGSQ
jgi:excisionase family DNA binding protein